MSKQPIDVNNLRDLIHNGKSQDPLIFLEALMSGQDPRQFSAIYSLILEINSFTDGYISKSDWDEVVDFASKHSRYAPVSIGESHSAAKTLAEYLYPKRKQIELKNGDNSSSVGNDPLNEDEIELFKEKFNDEF